MLSDTPVLPFQMEVQVTISITSNGVEKIK